MSILNSRVKVWQISFLFENKNSLNSKCDTN